MGVQLVVKKNELLKTGKARLVTKTEAYFGHEVSWDEDTQCDVYGPLKAMTETTHYWVLDGSDWEWGTYSPKGDFLVDCKPRSANDKELERIGFFKLLEGFPEGSWYFI